MVRYIHIPDSLDVGAAMSKALKVHTQQQRVSISCRNNVYECLQTHKKHEQLGVDGGQQQKAIAAAEAEAAAVMASKAQDPAARAAQ